MPWIPAAIGAAGAIGSAIISRTGNSGEAEHRQQMSEQQNALWDEYLSRITSGQMDQAGQQQAGVLQGLSNRFLTPQYSIGLGGQQLDIIPQRHISALTAGAAVSNQAFQAEQYGNQSLLQALGAMQGLPPAIQGSILDDIMNGVEIGDAVRRYMNTGDDPDPPTTGIGFQPQPGVGYPGRVPAYTPPPTPPPTINTPWGGR